MNKMATNEEKQPKKKRERGKTSELCERKKGRQRDGGQFGSYVWSTHMLVIAECMVNQ